MAPKCQYLFDQACGVSDSHVDFVSFERPVHKDLLKPLAYLKQCAAQQGFCLEIASGFRSFDRQLAIWNEKALAQRPVLDADSRPVTLSDLTERDRVFAILQWSALPGASRHHWGSEIDVFDQSAVDSNYRLTLTVDETRGSGPFAAFHHWLNNWLSEQHDFYCPYVAGRGWVSPEPWHLSYKPTADVYAQVLDSSTLRRFIAQSEIVLKDAILENWETIYKNYVEAYL